MNNQPITDNEMSAYIDGELSPQDRLSFQKRLQQDPKLNHDICELRKVKQQIQEQYSNIDIPPMPKLEESHTGNRMFFAKVASFSAILITFGFIWGHLQTFNTPPLPQKIALVTQNQNKILMHIDSDNPKRVNALLKQVSYILKNDPHKKVEVVANAKGIELFDQNKNNPYKAQLQKFLSQYGNLKLLACQRALARRALAGKPIHVMNNVETDRPALDEIVKKIKQGWQYQKI